MTVRPLALLVPLALGAAGCLQADIARIGEADALGAADPGSGGAGGATDTGGPRDAGVTCPASCDDGDPCTADSCDPATGACQHAAIPGCGQAPEGCTGAGAIPLQDAQWSTAEGDAVKVGGVAGLGFYGVCDTSVCGTCYSSLALSDGGHTMTMGTPPDIDAAWGCQSGQCSDVVDCTPLRAGVAYWAWGWTAWDDTYQGGGIPEADWAPGMQLIMEGFCLQTTPAGLVGGYEGVLYQDAAGFQADVRLTIAHSATTGWRMRLEETSPCLACGGPEPVPAQDVQDVWVDDGTLGFSALVSDGYGMHQRAWFRLAVQAHDLAGPFDQVADAAKKPGPGSGEAPAPVPPLPAVYGRLDVTRVAD